ncbi:MAG: FtsQ-type POTRA domain-containing protein [Treponema sp.]|jgi:cell division protein FtsQ|nr:FtsQ-type POTRA domain-containing protein [Treponema sp.]
MSSGYVYADELISAKTASSSKLDRVLKRLIMIIVLILAAELIWLTGISPCMPLASVEVSGIPGIDRGTVLALAEIDGQSSYVSVRSGRIEEALMALPQVGAVKVTKQFPNKVKILLESRRAVALSLAGIGGKIRPVYFDKDGVVFKIGSAGSLEDLSPSVPIISGLIFEQAAVGMRLPPEFTEFFTELERIGDGAPELLAALSEIRINRKAYDGFDLVLYPVHNPVKVRIGNNLNEDLLRYMILVIDVFKDKDINVEEIDFRTGTASYTVKEVSSG